MQQYSAQTNAFKIYQDVHPTSTWDIIMKCVRERGSLKDFHRESNVLRLFIGCAAQLTAYGLITDQLKALNVCFIHLLIVFLLDKLVNV